jgi:hypothetical protein
VDAESPAAGQTKRGGEAMNDVDYQSTLECLRIAARLIMPLDLDGFLQRAEAFAQGEAECESHLSIRRLARLARAMREDGGARGDGASVVRPAPRIASAPAV